MLINGYMFKLEPGWLLLVIGIINVPFYVMETRHMLSSKFIMTIGEIGPVESKNNLFIYFIYS